MKETCVSKTVSLKLGQVQWLTEQYGNVTRGMQSIIEDKMDAETNNRLAKQSQGIADNASLNQTGVENNG